MMPCASWILFSEAHQTNRASDDKQRVERLQARQQTSVHVECGLDLVGLFAVGQCQRKQDPCLGR